MISNQRHLIEYLSFICNTAHGNRCLLAAYGNHEYKNQKILIIFHLTLIVPLVTKASPFHKQAYFCPIENKNSNKSINKRVIHEYAISSSRYEYSNEKKLTNIFFFLEKSLSAWGIA